MPELPEVEIIKRDLSSILISKKITSTFVGDKKLKRIIPQLSVLNDSTILHIFRRIDNLPTLETSPRTYPQYNVYGLNNQPCKVCSTTIEKVMIAGRSSFFCPSCQK